MLKTSLKKHELIPVLSLQILFALFSLVDGAGNLFAQNTSNPGSMDPYSMEIPQFESPVLQSDSNAELAPWDREYSHLPSGNFDRPKQGFVNADNEFEPAIPHPGYGFSDPYFRENGYPEDFDSRFEEEFPNDSFTTPNPGYHHNTSDSFAFPFSSESFAPNPVDSMPGINAPEQNSSGQARVFSPSFPDSQFSQMETAMQPPRAMNSPLSQHPEMLNPSESPKKLPSDENDSDSRNMVLDVRVVGYGQIPLEKIRQKVKSRPNRPFNEILVEEDKRALTQTNWFIDVRPNIYRGKDGVIITYELIERPLLHYVKFIGNQTPDKKKLREEAMIAPGDALDPMAVHQAKSRIEDYYKNSGHHKVHVEVLSGDRPTDRGAVFLINEGGKQRIDRVKIVGSRVIGGGRIKTQIQSKPGIFYVIGGEFTREKLDQDVEKLTAYYRNLGFFFAKIDRDYEEGRGYLGFGKEDCWVSVRFIVDEGPRCKISSLKIEGNHVFTKQEILAVMKKTKIGGFYNYHGLETDIKRIKELYGRKGRVFTEVVPDYIVDVPRPNEGTIDLSIKIRESKQIRYGEVTADIYDSGGTKFPYTKIATVLNRAPNIRPGKLVDTAEIENTERRLRASSLFNTNPVSGIYIPEVILEVNEEERPFLFEDGEERLATENPGITRGQSNESRQKPSVYPTPPVSIPDPYFQHGVPNIRNTGFSWDRAKNVDEILREQLDRVDRRLDADAKNHTPYPNLPGRRNPGFSPGSSQWKNENPRTRPDFSEEKSAEEVIPIFRGQSGRTIPSLPSSSANPYSSNSTASTGNANYSGAGLGTAAAGSAASDATSWNSTPSSDTSSYGSVAPYGSTNNTAATAVARMDTAPYNPQTPSSGYGNASGSYSQPSAATNPVATTASHENSPYGSVNSAVAPFSSSDYASGVPPYGDFNPEGALNNGFGASQGGSTYPPQSNYLSNQNRNQGIFSPYPQPYVPGPNNPSTQAGGLMDPVFPGSLELQDYANSMFSPKPQPIMSVPARIRVQETQTGQLQMSVGVNSDSGVLAQFMYKEDNFDWRRPPSNPFRWEDWRNAYRGNGERFKIVAQPGNRTQRYETSWENPHFLNSDWSLGLSGYFYSRYYSEWRERRMGGTVSLGYALTPDLSFTTYYKGENVRVYDPIYYGIPDLDDALGDNGMHTFGIRIAHDTRDNRFLSTEGHMISLGIEQVLGEYQYPRISLDARQYFMLRERPDTSGRWVLGLRSAAGWTDIDTPIFERYYAGGFSSLRGFDHRGVSPRYGWVPIGGNFEFYNSAELLFPITADDMVRGVVFLDTGCVQSKIDDWAQKYRVAPGFGLRITIPIMGPAPIALDFAFPINKDPSDETEVFSFHVGFFRG